MRLCDLICEGRPAFPPKWQDPNTGTEPLRDDPLGGVLVEVEWGRQNLSLELTNFWRGRRLRGRLLTDDATVLPRVHALLSASIPRHVDELIGEEIPPPTLRSTGPSTEAAVDPPTEAALEGPSLPNRNSAFTLHPDVALLVATLIRKGLLTPDDIDATRRTMPEDGGSPSQPSQR
jgi:hypothetical protein